MSLDPVRICDACGEVGTSMDTVCARCRRRGSLRDSWRCLNCHRLVESPPCRECSGGIQAEPPTTRTRPNLGDPHSLSVPDVSKPEPPPWLTGLIGGVVAGAGIGVVAGLAMGEELWLTGPLGAVVGGVLGSIFTARRA